MTGAAGQGCGAPSQAGSVPGGLEGQVVLGGQVVAQGQPVEGAFVRLLDRSGDFVGEVVSSPEGAFRFFAAPGLWTVTALHGAGSGRSSVMAEGPGLHPVTVALA